MVATGVVVAIGVVVDVLMGDVVEWGKNKWVCVFFSKRIGFGLVKIMLVL